jgi:hypothetical protein
METANKIILEFQTRSVVATLHNPMTIGEIWAHFVARNHRPSIVTLSNHVARVTF